MLVVTEKDLLHNLWQLVGILFLLGNVLQMTGYLCWLLPALGNALVGCVSCYNVAPGPPSL
jgi:hypothetical protein